MINILFHMIYVNLICEFLVTYVGFMLKSLYLVRNAEFLLIFSQKVSHSAAVRAGCAYIVHAFKSERGQKQRANHHRPNLRKVTMFKRRGRQFKTRINFATFHHSAVSFLRRHGARPNSLARRPGDHQR